MGMSCDNRTSGSSSDLTDVRDCYRDNVGKDGAIAMKIWMGNWPMGGEKQQEMDSYNVGCYLDERRGTWYWLTSTNRQDW